MKHLLLLSAWCVGVCAGAAGQDAKKYPDPAPMTHDMSEFWTPQPKIVTPPDMDNAVVAPPSDAVVLLGLKDNAISEWVNCEEGKPVGWQIENGIMTVKPHSGSIRTKKDFGDFQLHLEWSAPTEIVGESQGRGNSGVFMQGMGLVRRRTRQMPVGGYLSAEIRLARPSRQTRDDRGIARDAPDRYERHETGGTQLS